MDFRSNEETHVTYLGTIKINKQIKIKGKGFLQFDLYATDQDLPVLIVEC